jgi:ankyrin repeat protein
MNSILLQACLVGDFEMVKELYCKAGNELDLDNTIQAFILVAQKGHLQILEYLHREVGINIQNLRALVAACDNGHLSIVKYLHQNGANIRLTDDYFLIYHASESGNISLVKYLFENGANCEQLTMNYSMRVASKKGYLDLVKYLIENGAKDDTRKALLWAADKGHLSVVRYLYETKISTDLCLALIMASRSGHLEVVKYLISVGAIVDDPAVKIAMINGFLVIIEFFYNNGIDIMNKELTDTDFFNVYDDSTYKNFKRCKRYISFCQKMEAKKRKRAQKKIYYWWIPICYDITRECGQRMKYKNLEKAKELGYEFNNIA